MQIKINNNAFNQNIAPIIIMPCIRFRNNKHLFVYVVLETDKIIHCIYVYMCMFTKIRTKSEILIIK